MPNWTYGDAYLHHPIQEGVAIFENDSCLKTHNLFDDLPSFMLTADIIFVDPPWNKGNMTSFYTKADMPPPVESYDDFFHRLFACIKDISPQTCYVEIGKEHLADFVMDMRGLFKYVTFYNSTYYHNSKNLCYVVRGSKNRIKPSLDGMDEENMIKWVCENETYTCIGDLCMGRGLVAENAFLNGKRFVGTELNHKRLSVAIERIYKRGGRYKIVY